MRVLVCGGRYFSDAVCLNNVLIKLQEKLAESDKKIDVIIHGAAPGADSLAGEWAKANNIPVESYPADWNTHGRSAGHIRNKQMLVDGKPNIIVAMPGGRGTSNMIEISKRAGIKVLDMSEIKWDVETANT